MKNVHYKYCGEVMRTSHNKLNVEDFSEMLSVFFTIFTFEPRLLNL